MSSALSLLFSKIKEKIIYLFIYGCTGSSGCVQVFSSCERGLLFTAVCRFSLLWLLLLRAQALGMQTSVVVACGSVVATCGL